MNTSPQNAAPSGEYSSFDRARSTASPGIFKWPKARRCSPAKTSLTGYQPAASASPSSAKTDSWPAPRSTSAAGARWLAVPSGAQGCQELTMVSARPDDGQELCALNEIFVGHTSHQSARHELTTPDGRLESQSSSGLVVATGTGATSWCASIALERGGRALPAPSDPRLAWFVREAWPSPATGVSLTEGLLDSGQALRIRVASDQLVIFGDGMEDDRITASWGQEITVQLGSRPLRLVQ
ncbi:hypothetical protein [Arthrobacter sp. A2-55]|uniref:hypothetical protein n=1 Tax=Arthrobacter sp. A2-55 TaxID=2897337 RepID=UPI0021CDCD96|nr:hypothetical protein [Arthrobacter sp. A2-55]MCU6482737.1 hypothetical protein [Arthrobacter sp. A2-55]